MVDVKKRLSEGWILCRATIELVGKPKEHIEKTMHEYIEKIKKEEPIELVNHNIEQAEKVDTGSEDEGMMKEAWMTFADVEMLVKEPMTLTSFCFNYMPASLEIVEPRSLEYSNTTFTEFFNDFQARLHQLDMLTKKMKSELMFLRKNTNKLLRNYLTLLLKTRDSLTSGQMSKFTGVSKDRVEDFLDNMIDEDLVEMEGENYRWIKDD